MTRCSAIVACTALVLLIASHEPRAQAQDQADAAQITLRQGTWKATVAHIQKQYRGKVVVIDMWSTACIPCMREFPNLVSLQKQYGDRVACVSFNCDYAGIKKKPPEYYRERALKFLKKKNATFLNVLSSTPADELFDEVKLASIPAVYVFGTDGKLINRFDNDEQKYGDEFTYKKHIIPLIEKTLAK